MKRNRLPLRSVRIIEGVDGLNALGSAWGRLEHSAVSPMQQFIWAQACASAFTRESELRIVIVEKGTEVVAIAPLVQHHGKPSLEMLGVTELSEPTDVLYADSDALLTLATGLVDLGVPLVLNRVPADSLLPNVLEKAFRGHGALFCPRDNSWPYIPLDSSWVEPESHLNAGRRSDLRRSHRIAEDMGPVSSEVLSPVPSTLAPFFEDALAIEAASWKGETQTAMAMDPVRGAFYRQYATAACEKGILRLCYLRIGKLPAAMQIAVESGGRLWLLKIGYDKRFARCSPGILLLRETLRYASIRGLASLEFLGNVEHWIRAWTWQERSCVTIRGYPFGLRGINRLASDAVSSLWNKLGHLSMARK